MNRFPYVSIKIPVLRMFLFLISLGAFTMVYAQEAIQFNQPALWKEATEKAAAENKLIFVDCYTSWCAPCKWMDKNVFVDPTVADFFNANFINMKIDMEKGEGIELRKRYQVQSFPTFLFVNAQGEVVHRTGSKMSVEEFLEQGKLAISPTGNLAFLKKKYEEGQRDIPFLIDYYEAVLRSDRAAADKLRAEIIENISDEQLRSELGWRVINALARTENDRLGAFFLNNKTLYTAWSSEEERAKLEERLVTSTMYRLISSQDKQAFMDKLSFFKDSDLSRRKIEGVMLEADFYLEAGNEKVYKKVTNAALKKELKNEAEKLSFLARRADYKGASSPVILKQAYRMAKRAVELEPEEYSIQSTFAKVCLSLKKKEEGLKAARVARHLADAETSKIQNLAQALVDQLEAL